MNAKEERKKEKLKSSSQSILLCFLSLSLSLSLSESSLSLCFVFQIVWSPGKQTKQSNQTYKTHEQHTHTLSLSLMSSFLLQSLPAQDSLTPQLSSFFSLFYYVLLFSRLSLLHWFCLSVREKDYWNALTHFGLVKLWVFFWGGAWWNICVFFSFFLFS